MIQHREMCMSLRRRLPLLLPPPRRHQPHHVILHCSRLHHYLIITLPVPLIRTNLKMEWNPMIAHAQNGLHHQNHHQK